jgi:hypothetical protein
MRKQDELSNPNSCLNKARDNEWLFTLLERDLTAPATIRFWVAERIRKGLNHPRDAQIQEALTCAQEMEDERGRNRKEHVWKDIDSSPGLDGTVQCRICKRVELTGLDREDPPVEGCAGGLQLQEV